MSSHFPDYLALRLLADVEKLQAELASTHQSLLEAREDARSSHELLSGMITQLSSRTSVLEVSVEAIETAKEPTP